MKRLFVFVVCLLFFTNVYAATNFPGSLDSYSTKNSGDTITEGHVNDIQDAVEAIEAKIGIGASTPTVGLMLQGTGTGSSNWANLTFLGAWVNKSASYGAQQAATDGFVIVTTVNSASGYLRTDSANPPTTLRGTLDAIASINSCMTPVKKGDYWMFTLNDGTIAVWWIPLGN